jgi:mannose-6-phosphate isomerase-like protein (cupin superfamily)
MKKLIAGFIVGLAVGVVAATAALVSGPLRAAAIEPQARGASTSTSTVKIVLDNARVRVRDVTFPPGVTGMHTHELAHVGVVIQGGTLVFRYPDGKSETMKLEAGGAGFREANVTHEPTNPGSSPVRVIEVELK